MTPRGIIIAIAVFIGVVLLGLGLTGESEDDGVPPSSVIEEVREEFPHTRTDDIAYSYQDIKEQDPDATDDEIAEWLKEAVQANEEVEEWNDCLDTSPTGDGCREPRTELSDENPLGW